jgi:hypothetical protein
MAETAAGALATMATGAVLNMLPEGSDEAGSRKGRGRRGGGRRRDTGGKTSS